MKLNTIIATLSLIPLLSAGAVAAHEIEANVEAHAHEGGLGNGISSMVRGILGETDVLVDESAPAPAPMSAAEARVMAAPAQLEMMSLKADTSAAADASFMASIPAPSEQDVGAHVRTLLESDSRVQSVDVADGHVRITYAVRTKIFNLIPKTLAITGGVYASGETEVAYPWYAMFAKNVSAGFDMRIESATEGFANADGFSASEQIQIIDTLYAALSAEFAAPAAAR